MRVEECWVLIGTHRGRHWRARAVRHRDGEWARVEADAAWILRREETCGGVFGFLHTHPMGGLSPSQRDVRTMRAWRDAFGKPLLCAIADPSGVAGWRFDDYRSDGKKLKSLQLL